MKKHKKDFKIAGGILLAALIFQLACTSETHKIQVFKTDNFKFLE